MRLAFALALGTGLALAVVPPVARADSGLTVGQPAPAFALTTVAGKHVTLSQYRGKTLVINVWGSWCPPCRIETPDLVRAAKTANPATTAFLGVDTTETPETVRAYVAAKGVPYPQVATTASSPFAEDYAIRNYPTTIVVDPQGVVRAIHADNVLPYAQLTAYIDAARVGRSAELISEEQTRLDAMLAPARYPFAGEPATVLGNVRAAAAAIAKADDELDDAMDDPTRDHDLLKTKREEATLRDAAITALGPLATTTEDKTLFDRLRGDQYAALSDWTAAQGSYTEALAIDPKNIDALGGREYVAQKTGDVATEVATETTIAALSPSAGSYEALGRGQARAGMKDASYASFDRAAQLAMTPGTVALAHVDLYAARSALLLGDRARAKTEFARAGIAAGRLPARDPRRTWYLEQAQEGTIALGLIAGAKPEISLAPWTGPDLPGSIKSTAKYRLVVVGPPLTTVVLHAAGLPSDWIASFCSDRICSPFNDTVHVPADGVKIVELQIVPRSTVSGPVAVRVSATIAGRFVGAASTAVALR